MTSSSAATAALLADRLAGILTVDRVPLHDRVAQLDTSGPHWVLHLDSGSPPIDHCWALLDVLRILALGVDAAEGAVASRRLRLVPGCST